jgi:cyanophycin synthetase
MDLMIRPGTAARIPIAAIAGSDGDSMTARLTAHILGRGGRVVGAATADGVRIGPDIVAHGDHAGASGVKMLLLDPLVEAAVIEFSPRALITQGLYIDWCDVGVVLRDRNRAIATDGLPSTEEMDLANHLVVAFAKRMAVLDADDPLCPEMAAGLAADRRCLVSCIAESPEIGPHCQGGQPAVWLDESRGQPTVVLHDGSVRHDVIAISELPIATSGPARNSFRHAMFAAAICFGLGESLQTIRNGLATFVGAIPAP